MTVKKKYHIHMAAEDSTSYWEIDSSNKRDSWLYSAMQSMSFEQLDTFFSTVKNLVYGPCSGHRAIYNAFWNRQEFFLFQTNRIEKRLRIAFQYNPNAYGIDSVLLDFLYSLMFIVCDGSRRKILKSIRMRRGTTTAVDKKISNEFKRYWLSLVENSTIIVPVDKMFDVRGFLFSSFFRQVRYFYYERLADDSLPTIALLTFGIFSVVLLFLVFPLCY